VLKALGPNGILINVARGSVVDEWRIRRGGGEDGLSLSACTSPLVHHRTARDIDQDAVRPERLEHLGIDEVFVAAPPGVMTIRTSTSCAISTRFG